MMDPEISVRFDVQEGKIIAKIFSHIVCEVQFFESLKILNEHIELLGFHPFLDQKRGKVGWLQYLIIPDNLKGRNYGGKVVSRILTQSKKYGVKRLYAHAETKESEIICEKLGAERLPLLDDNFCLKPFKKELK